MLEHFASLLRPGGVAYVSHAERAHARAARAPSSRTTRGTCRSTAPRSSARCCAPALRRASSCSACSTRASCALHELALRAGWDRVHPRAAASPSRSTTASCPAIDERDFALRAGRRSSARSTSWRCCRP